MEILVRRETTDEQRAIGAQTLPGMDLVHSKVDGAIVVVALDHDERHVCWCGERFNESIPRLKRVEVQLGYSRVYLHAGCEPGRRTVTISVPQLISHVRELQVQAGMKKVIEGSNRIAKAALEGARRIIGP